MNKLSLIASVLAVLGLTACEKGLENGILDVGSGQVKNSLLQVRTRSGSEATISYPLQVFVFQGEDCKAAQTIGDEGQTLNIPLTEGTYTVYAVGGASATDYVLPSADDATTTTALTLREGHEHGDLMSASATVTLADGEANTVTLGLERKAMLLQSVVIRKIPTAATAVSVSVSPLWQSLTVGGSYAGTGGSYTMALEKQSDNRTWQSTETAYLLPPSSSPASITVRITTAGGTRGYTYSTADQLEAGYKINIDGTYTEAVGVTLTGTITGATWLGERTISFDFDESGSSASEPENPETPDNPEPPENNFPSAGDTYEGCYVLAVTVEEGGESAELTLLSPNEKSVKGNSVTFDLLQSTAAAHGTDGISGWRPMTRSEAELLQAAHADLDIADNHNYLFDDSGTVKQMLMSDGDVSTPTSSTAYIRPVATVTINNE